MKKLFVIIVIGSFGLAFAQRPSTYEDGSVQPGYEHIGVSQYEIIFYNGNTPYETIRGVDPLIFPSLKSGAIAVIKGKEHKITYDPRFEFNGSRITVHIGCEETGRGLRPRSGINRQPQTPRVVE